jgi:hypothetical protein
MAVMERRQWLRTLLIATALLMSTGCTLLLIGGGVAAGAGTIAYIKGELKSTEEVSLGRAWEASQAAMKDLEFSITSKEKDALSAKLIARGAGDRKITVTLKKVSDSVTEIRIRVDTFGDESLSRMILEKMKKHY